jgi:hypothetical protein
MSPPPPTILATVSPSRPRAIFAIGVMSMLGAILLSTALASPPADLGWLALLVAFGGIAVFSAWRIFRAMDDRIVLTPTALVTASGVEICALSEVRSVERGALAFKPTGGFLIRLDRPRARAWTPGLWWRFGRSVGVGGITRAAEARTMADIIAMDLAQRN